MDGNYMGMDGKNWELQGDYLISWLDDDDKCSAVRQVRDDT